ncbi:MAG: tetratricopeptide repeat protein [Acidobacteriota bacterium]
MKLGWIKNGVLCCLLWTGAAQAQQPAPGSLDGVLTIEDPTERIAALQKFLKTNIIADQTLAAREAIVASYAQLAETQLAENNIEKAVTEFRKALATLPDKITDQFFEETVIRIPLAVSVRGYREEAISLARQLEKRFPKEPGRLARLGEFYLTIEDSPDAIRSLEVAAKESANDARLHRALGSAYRMGLQLDEAIAEYQLAIGADAQDKRAYYELANLYRAHGAYADAIKLYRKQIEIDPKHASSLKGIALASLAQGDEEQALAALNQARDLRGSADEITQDIYLQTQLAFLYLKQNKLKQARQASDAALLIEPRYAWARLAAAEVELADGKYFEAERHLLAAARYANFPTLMFTLGKLYLLVEDFDGALEQFGKAFKYSAKEKFTTRLGGALDVQSERLKDLLAREHQAAIFLAEAPTTDEQFKIAEALVRFSYWQREVKNLRDAKPPANIKTARKAAPAVSRKDMEELDQAALEFAEAENIRRSFRSLYVAQQLAQVGLATGLAVELAEQALGLAEVATEADGSLRDYPNYDRDGRVRIFRGRALDAKGWALFKAGKNEDAIASLQEAVQAYGSLPEVRQAQWHLATVKEAAGDLPGALDLYIAAYELPRSNEADVNRAIIELLYRKVHGSLAGLEAKIGRPLTDSSVSLNTAPTEKPKTEPAPVKLQPRPSKSREPKEAQSKISTSFVKDGALNAPPPAPEVTPPTPPAEKAVVSDNNADKAAPVTNEPAPALVAPKPIELPAFDDATDPLARRLPLIDSATFARQWEIEFSLPGNLLLDEIPPPPAPKTYTRKRRVTSPDDAPPKP